MAAFLVIPWTSFAQFTGGPNDGASSGIFCGGDLNGTMAPAIAISAIAGSPTFCSSNSENYNITVTSGVATIYNWSTPTGAILNGTNNTLISSTVTVNFGISSGTISLTASNGCTSASASLSVSAISCNQYLGGNNDGYSAATFCGNDLNGTSASALALNPINGPASFCSGNAEAYSVSLSSPGIVTSFLWTAPSGTVLAQTANTDLQSSITNFLFAAAGGNVSVTATNGCSTTTAVLAVSAIACNNFIGGSNDGFGFAAFCGNNLNGASAPGITLNPISGPASFCVNESQIYAISLSSGTADSFAWTTPPGTTLTTPLNTPTSSANNFLFGAGSGTISVNVVNSCGTATASLALIAVNCNDFLGGNNDGFSTGFFCGDDLNGTTPGMIALTPVSGNPAFCNNLGQNYSVTLTSGIASLFVWTIPPGSALGVTRNSLTSSTVNINFATSGGVVQVTAQNTCSTVTNSLTVIGQDCANMLGGINDGFALGKAVNIPLPIELISFNAVADQADVLLSWATASELNNDYFTVQRSRDGVEFEPVTIVPGALTSQLEHHYTATDKKPYTGLSYYRLKQTDVDGYSSYSKVVAVELTLDDITGFDIYPNPTASKDFDLKFGSFLTGKECLLQVNDFAGRSVTQIKIIGQPMLSVSIESHAFKPGVYLVIIYFNDQKWVRKLVVL